MNKFRKGVLAGYEIPNRYSLKEKREQHRAAAKADAMKHKWIHPEKRNPNPLRHGAAVVARQNDHIAST